MSHWKLPTSLTVGGKEHPIRTDFRDILTILQAFNDPDLPDWGKTQVMLQILFEDPEAIPVGELQEACTKAIEFIDNGKMPKEKPPVKRPVLMDWEQDADLIIPAVNKIAGTEIRSLPYLHWWTFLGYYMEIGESLFSSVVSIRQKHAKGKKLEKWEREFERENRDVIRIRRPLSEEEQERLQAEEAALKELWG